ncbi:restriction endonuclease [Polynucleobacter paneuropaeus]|nr:restriction endonuclease [Polynucleobacter paneuropaeus]
MIPIQNLYYLLCYSWNRLDEAELVDINIDEFDAPQDLLARILLSGTKKILKKGLDRNYQEYSEETSSIRGRVNFSESISRLLFPQAKASVTSDELSNNVLHNQILRSTISNLSKAELLNPILRHELKKTTTQLGDIDLIRLNSQVFRRVQLHRNNSFYAFLMDVCELIHLYLLPNHETGSFQFKDFTRDEKKMQLVFEEFARNFYLINQKDYVVKAETLRWEASGNTDALAMLPNMYTDISLISPERKIIIDTKYYKEAFNENQYGGIKFRSANLYQLNAYLDYSQPIEGQNLDGILLYPATVDEFTYSFFLRGHAVKIAAVDLRRNPAEIHRRMLEIIS